jgi:hypothetical protein
MDLITDAIGPQVYQFDHVLLVCVEEGCSLNPMSHTHYNYLLQQTNIHYDADVVAYLDFDLA